MPAYGGLSLNHDNLITRVGDFEGSLDTSNPTADNQRRRVDGHMQRFQWRVVQDAFDAA
jgi:hypothetical protein